MRERRGDTVQATVLAVALHALLLGLVLFGGFWRTVPQTAAAGSPVSADVVDPNALSQATRRALAERPDPVVEPTPPEPVEPLVEAVEPTPQPLPEPRPEEASVAPQQVAQEPVPVPDAIDQDAARRDALSAETAAREQERKRRQQQIDLTERQRQEQVEEQRRLAEQVEKERKLAEIRRQRAAAAREAEQAEARLMQLADARARSASQAAASDTAASAPPGQGGNDDALRARYAAALIDAIQRNWTRPDNVPVGQRCQIIIRQAVGGEVLDVEISASCPYDELGRRSVEAAVLKAQPLPYAGFESVFNRRLILNFQAPAG